MADGPWHVVAEPLGSNPALRPAAAKKAGRKKLTGSKEHQDKDNVGGVVVFLRNASIKHEVARVGFVRDNSENPKQSFEEKMDEVLSTAEKSCTVLNQYTPDGALV